MVYQKFIKFAEYIRKVFLEIPFYSCSNRENKITLPSLAINIPYKLYLTPTIKELGTINYICSDIIKSVITIELFAIMLAALYLASAGGVTIEIAEEWEVVDFEADIIYSEIINKSILILPLFKLTAITTSLAYIINDVIIPSNPLDSTIGITEFLPNKTKPNYCVGCDSELSRSRFFIHFGETFDILNPPFMTIINDKHSFTLDAGHIYKIEISLNIKAFP